MKSYIKKYIKKFLDEALDDDHDWEDIVFFILLTGFSILAGLIVVKTLIYLLGIEF